MDPAVANQLIDLNRRFYTNFGGSFSSTRRRLQPGVKKILETIRENDSVLDLGCGNGHFLHELNRRRHKGILLGADFSRPLLREAISRPGVEFCEVDLTRPAEFRGRLSEGAGWDVVTMFATLHHIPSHEIRQQIMQTVGALLKSGGRAVLSNWQFLNSIKLKQRVQTWDRIGLRSDDVEAGDYLLDWRSGGEGLRYVHHFSREELHALVAQAGLEVGSEFVSDGENGTLGLYQVVIRRGD